MSRTWSAARKQLPDSAPAVTAGAEATKASRKPEEARREETEKARLEIRQPAAEGAPGPQRQLARCRAPATKRRRLCRPLVPTNVWPRHGCREHASADANHPPTARCPSQRIAELASAWPGWRPPQPAGPRPRQSESPKANAARCRHPPQHAPSYPSPWQKEGGFGCYTDDGAKSPPRRGQTGQLDNWTTGQLINETT